MSSTTPTPSRAEQRAARALARERGIGYTHALALLRDGKPDLVEIAFRVAAAIHDGDQPSHALEQFGFTADDITHEFSGMPRLGFDVDHMKNDLISWPPHGREQVELRRMFGNDQRFHWEVRTRRLLTEGGVPLDATRHLVDTEPRFAKALEVCELVNQGLEPTDAVEQAGFDPEQVYSENDEVFALDDPQNDVIDLGLADNVDFMVVRRHRDDGTQVWEVQELRYLSEDGVRLTV